MRLNRLVAVAAVAMFGTAFAQVVPDRITFNARLADTLGAPITGSHALGFSLFSVATGGTAAWTESYPAANFTAEGLVFLELGSTTALTTTILDGSKLFLEITVDGTPMTPRVGVVSVPYAIRATEAARVGTLTAAAIQQRVSGTCIAGSSIRVINPDGTVLCEADDVGGVGGITSVTTSGTSGLQGGGAGPALTLGLANCAANQILKSTGANTWGCAADVDTDTNTTYTAAGTGGLLLTGTAFSMGNCPVGQVMAATGVNTWACNTLATNFILNGVASQTANFNITGVGTIQGNTLIGSPTINAARPNGRLMVRGPAAAAGTGVVSGSGSTRAVIGFGTAFLSQVNVGDILIAAGQAGREVLAVTNDTNLTVDLNYPADYFNLTFTVQKAIASFQDSAGNAQLTINSQGKVIRPCPANSLPVRDTSLCVSSFSFCGSFYGTCEITCRRSGGHICTESEMASACDSNAAGYAAIPGFGVAGAGAIPNLTWIGDSSSADDIFKRTNAGACDNLDGPAVNGRGVVSNTRCCYDNGR